MARDAAPVPAPRSRNVNASCSPKGRSRAISRRCAARFGSCRSASAAKSRMISGDCQMVAFMSGPDCSMRRRLPSAVTDVRWPVLVQPPAELVVEVLSEAGRERLFHRELVVAASVGLAFGSEEEGGAGLLAAEPLGEFEPVGDEEDRDLGLQQGAGDLVTDLGSLTLVGPGEGLVEQHQAVRPDL